MTALSKVIGALKEAQYLHSFLVHGRDRKAVGDISPRKLVYMLSVDLQLAVTNLLEEMADLPEDERPDTPVHALAEVLVFPGELDRLYGPEESPERDAAIKARCMMAKALYDILKQDAEAINKREAS